MIQFANNSNDETALILFNESHLQFAQLIDAAYIHFFLIFHAGFWLVLREAQRDRWNSTV